MQINSELFDIHIHLSLLGHQRMRLFSREGLLKPKRKEALFRSMCANSMLGLSRSRSCAVHLNLLVHVTEIFFAIRANSLVELDFNSTLAAVVAWIFVEN
jgi:hypothetical protein